MVPVPAADLRRGILADGEPGLGEVPLVEVVGRAGAAHLRRNPSRVDGVARHVRPAARDGERERGEVELAVGVGLAGVPLPSGPVDVVERSAALAVHPAAQVDQAVRTVDPRRQHVGSEDVHGQGPRVTLGRRVPRGLEIDAGVVDDGVHAAEGVDLVGDGARLGRAAEIPDGHTHRARREIGEDGRALAAARVQHDLVALVEESAGGGEAEPVGGAGDEDTSHAINYLVLRVRGVLGYLREPDPDLPTDVDVSPDAPPRWQRRRSCPSPSSPRTPAWPRLRRLRGRRSVRAG